MNGNMNYAERALAIKIKVDEALASYARYDDLLLFVEPFEEICKEILINEFMLDKDIYKALTIIRQTEGEGGEPFEHEYDMPYFGKCLNVFAKPSSIIHLGLLDSIENNTIDEAAENKIISINNIEYKTIEAYRLYGEKENELENIAYSLMMAVKPTENN
ncbi:MULTISPECIES: hypothetical protein [Pseudomonas]|uniref:Uncharacterized protein n=1 Tax=Pseudomonas putida (strain DOT-T1E) TaxID=1196325 RepID=I7BBA6_PSEPT|nr:MULTISPECIES: hypothetical protein [Pseudomonas]AFO48758.1 hypothetical protein T1E_2919 [Pseudomonas putida DOT-T1E]OVZ07040.1 hypothetical protein CDO37_19995 [Pseudomonas aeruginosa]UZM92177.1 hypothetical protein OPZ46_20225 [Pseudomonas putida DOT-T1E]